MSLLRVVRRVPRVGTVWWRCSARYSDLSTLRPYVKEFVEKNIELCKPAHVHVCNGSKEENDMLLNKLVEQGRLINLTKYDNCYLARTSPEDVARLEDRTFICTPKERDAIPIPKKGVKSQLGYWKEPQEMETELKEKFSGCMEGRTMYVIPFSMGPIKSPLAKIGIQLTDSEYVVASMRIMTRMGSDVLKRLEELENLKTDDQSKKDMFVRCLHSVGYPLSQGREDVTWPCNPDAVTIAHFPERNEIKSFGSGYGGNSLLGKKCFALRIASSIARKEGWLAEHMLILGITDPAGKKRYIAAAFPSACGKTNLAMMKPTLPGWKVECVGDDIAWMKFDSEGQLRAINPENGFFGVAPGTSSSSNPHAMEMVKSNTIFTNVGHTSDGGVYWEGMDDVDLSTVSVTSWKGEENWTKESAEKAAHPNSRFCTPTSQCSVVDPSWEDSKGVPIDAIIFGGRRPSTIPLVFESFNWQHGVFLGASMRSETTAAAKLKKEIRHDPFAMKPFFGYSFAQYLEHWLSLENRKNAKVPKIFFVNWFRKNSDGGFIWPGFGENSRVLEWILKRVNGESVAKAAPLGMIPKSGTINTDGLGNVDMQALFTASKQELEAEAAAIEKFFNEQLPEDLPDAMKKELQSLQDRIAKLPDDGHSSN